MHSPPPPPPCRVRARRFVSARPPHTREGSLWLRGGEAAALASLPPPQASPSPLSAVAGQYCGVRAWLYQLPPCLHAWGRCAVLRALLFVSLCRQTACRRSCVDALVVLWSAESELLWCAWSAVCAVQVRVPASESVPLMCACVRGRPGGSTGAEQPGRCACGGEGGGRELAGAVRGCGARVRCAGAGSARCGEECGGSATCVLSAVVSVCGAAARSPRRQLLAEAPCARLGPCMHAAWACMTRSRGVEGVPRCLPPLPRGSPKGVSQGGLPRSPEEGPSCACGARACHGARAHLREDSLGRRRSRGAGVEAWKHGGEDHSPIRPPSERAWMAGGSDSGEAAGAGAGRGQRARGWWICTRWGSRATGSEGGSQLRFARCPLSPPRARLLHTAGAAHHDALAAPAPGPPSLAPERPRWVSFGFQPGRFSRQLSGAAIRARGDAAGSVRGRRCSAEATGRARTTDGDGDKV